MDSKYKLLNRYERNDRDNQTNRDEQMNKNILPGDKGVSLARADSGDITSCVINGVTTNAVAKEGIPKYSSVIVVPGGNRDEPYVVPKSVGVDNSLLAIQQGAKSDISTTASQLSTTSVRIYKEMTIKVRSLGTGTYIGIGNYTGQEYRLTGVGDTKDIDFIDNLTDLYVVADSGNTSSLEWLGA